MGGGQRRQTRREQNSDVILDELWVKLRSLLSRQPSPKPQTAEKRVVVLADLANTTNDAAFGATLRQVLAGELGKSAAFSVLSDVHVSQTLRLMVRTPDIKLTPEIASEICERTGSAAVVDGSIIGLGRNYLLSLRARN